MLSDRYVPVKDGAESWSVYDRQNNEAYLEELTEEKATEVADMLSTSSREVPRDLAMNIAKGVTAVRGEERRVAVVTDILANYFDAEGM